MNQIGTTGTKLLSTSRAPRKGQMRKMMHLVPEVGRAAPDHKLSLFVTQKFATGVNSQRGFAATAKPKPPPAPACGPRFGPSLPPSPESRRVTNSANPNIVWKGLLPFGHLAPRCS